MKDTVSKKRLSRLRQANRDLSLYGKFTDRQSTEIISETYLALCEAVNSPVSLGFYLRYKYREYRQLVEDTITPENYTEVGLFEGDYLVSRFLSKYPYFDTGIDREAVAFSKWVKAEEQCQQTNILFRNRWDGGQPLAPLPVEQVLFLAQRKISDILGDIPRDILQHGRFGPGSDLSTNGPKVDSYYKYSSPGTVTAGVLSLFSSLGYDDDDRRLDALQECRLVTSSKLVFVPKTAKTDRAISVEPRWNMFLQLSIGECIEKRLRHFGVDISNQQTNRDLARCAYHLDLATVDLSSASDTIAKNLVLDLLPDDWSDLLFRVRTPRTTYKDSTYSLEKIASTGNGFTFPLETLIFYSLAWGVAKHLGYHEFYVSAYGDDLIVPQGCITLLYEVLSYCGFTVNTEKSFTGGDFFESCGSDYFKGKNVRPVFLKERISNVERAFGLANQITEFARRRHSYGSACARIMVSWSAVVRRIPEALRFYGPVGYGDSFLHCTFDRAKPTLQPLGDGWQGYACLGIVPSPVRFPAFGEGLIFSKIASPSLSGNSVTRRGKVTSKVKKLVVFEFKDYAIV